MRAATLLMLVLAAGHASAMTIVLDHAGVVVEKGEVCRFRATDRENPFERWLVSQDVICVAAGSAMTIPTGSWNVFGKADGLVSRPRLLDAASAPDTLSLSLEPAATITPLIPPGTRGVVYAPRLVSAWPVAADRVSVPSGADLWLMILEKSVPVAVVPIPPLESGATRAIDARTGGPSAVIGWLKVSESDQVVLANRRNLTPPHVRLTGTALSRDADPLPPLTLLNGAFIRVTGGAAGDSELEAGGPGWSGSTRRFKIASSITPIADPLVVRVATTIIVNWSTSDDLPALNRTIGACEPGKPAHFEITVSSCARPEGRGADVDPATCSEVRTEVFAPEMTLGSFTVEDVIPGFYRAELRFGNLPPVGASAEAAAGEILNLRLHPRYMVLYGSLTRGGEPLGEDTSIRFPGGGVGFLARDDSDYRAALVQPLGVDAQITVAACDGAPLATVLTDRVTRGNARFDISIPANDLTVNVSDTFTREPLPGSTVRVTFMSLRVPRRPVFMRTVMTDDKGRTVLTALPEREMRILVKHAGYQEMNIDPFSMTEREEKTLDVQLVPLRGNRGKIHSQRPFEAASIIWFSAGGIETETAEVAADGTFVYASSHENSETMSVISTSHPLWTTRSPAIGRRDTMEVRFPDDAPRREFSILIERNDPRAVRHVGLIVGGLRVPLTVLRQHQTMRRLPSAIQGARPVHFGPIAETGGVEILLGPLIQNVSGASNRIDQFVLSGFADAPRQRLLPGATGVVFLAP